MKKKFKSEGSYSFIDKGEVYYVRLTKPYWRWELNELIGQDVIIDGVTRRVKGIETHTLNAINSGSLIGFLV